MVLSSISSLTVTFTLFAVIDIVHPGARWPSWKNGQYSRRTGNACIRCFHDLSFLFAGKQFLSIPDLIFIHLRLMWFYRHFLIGIEMVLGKEIFHSDPNSKGGNVVPIAFPIIGRRYSHHHYVVKSNYDQLYILNGIIINLVVVWFRNLNHSAGLKEC